MLSSRWPSTCAAHQAGVVHLTAWFINARTTRETKHVMGAAGAWYIPAELLTKGRAVEHISHISCRRHVPAVQTLVEVKCIAKHPCSVQYGGWALVVVNYRSELLLIHQHLQSISITRCVSHESMVWLKLEEKQNIFAIVRTKDVSQLPMFWSNMDAW